MLSYPITKIKHRFNVIVKKKLRPVFETFELYSRTLEVRKL